MADASRPVHRVLVERNVPVRMRDGVTLMADVHRPDSPGRFPVILERTPYDKTASSETRFGAGEFFASRGFVAVFQDVRGRFASQGDFYPFRDDGWGERQDGYDTVEWCAVQPWSTGRIGTIGGSYSGATQYRMLPTRPPHLTCQFVRQSSSDYHNEWVYRSGAFELAFNLSWTLRHTANHATRIAAPAEAPAVKAGLDAAVADLDRWFSHLPQDPMPPMQGAYDWYRDWLAHPDDGPYWRQWNIASKHQDVNTPVFHLGSWFDGFLRGAIENYTGIRRHGRSSLARASQRLLIGPWVHGPDSVATPKVGEADFGPTAALPFNEFRLPWFDYWLKDIPNGVMDTAPVRVFTMGANTWQDLSDWPPPGVRYAPLYLRSGKSNSARSLNDGVASFTAPDETSSSDSYEYDPMRPVPHLGGGHLGPKNGAYDQRPVENRVLTYTTDPLTADLEVTGPVKAVLHAHSTARDTDWVVRLTDVRPDGTSMLVCDGVLRARYRRSQTTPELLTGGIEQYEIDLWATSYLFKRGHRLRVAVTSSCFPRWDRNMNTGGHNSRESKGVVATNTVFHDASRPSHLVLPVIPR